MLKKMKTRKRLAALITLITLFAFSSVMTVMTAAQEASLVSATLTTDKESYEEGENVNIALTVKNGNIYGIDKVKSEIGLPDGLTLKKGELTDGGYTLAAGQSRSNEITAYIEKASKPGDTTDPVNPGNPETDGSLCPLWLTLSILSGGTLAVLGIKKKCGKRIFSLFLCAVISLTALPTDVFADEVVMPNASGSVTVSKDITVNGAKKTITAEVTYNENKPSEEDEVTVTFDAGDGTPVAPITVKKGETISRLPESFGAGKAFMGWFTDTAFTTEFFTNTPVNEDMTVYASFVESADDFKSGVRTTYYVEDCAEYQPITLICDEEITANNVWEYITLFAYTGDTPENFVVTSNEKDEYTLVPETAYTAGCMYRMTAGEGVTFKGLDDTVNEYTFKIYKEQTNIIEVRDNIKYLDKAKLFATDKTDEYMVQADYFEENSLAVGDVLCIDNGTKNFTEDCLFVKITDTIKDRNIYYIQTADCEAEDVYDNVDVYFVEPAKNKFLEEQIDTEAIAEEVKNSEGVQQLNLVLAALLAEDETVNEIMEGEPLVTDTVTATAYAASDDDRLKDFSDYSRPKEDTLKSIAASLAIGLSVSVKVGEAENDNFTTVNPDYWSVITFELNYKTTIKKKLKVDATFTVTASENFYFNHHSDYQKVALHFSANYDRALMNVTYNYYNYAGDKKSTTVKTPYGTRPEFFLSSWPYGKKFIGYTPDGGKTVYDADTVYNEQLPYVYEDTVYDAVYEAGIFDVEIQYYDDVAREFKTYKTLKIEGGSKVPQSVFDEAWSKSNWQEGTTIQFIDWSDVYLSEEYGDAYLNEFIPDKTLIYKSIILRPRFKRNVTIKLDAGDGRLIFEESKEFKSYSQDKYEVEISRWATKDADKYNDYQPTGWKDSTTGEIYALGQTVKIDYSTTLTAIYQATPKTYKVNVSTPYGVLLNGEKTDKFSGGYDDYLAFVEKYNNYTPADVEGEGYTLVFKSSSSKASEDGLTLDIVFGNWQKNVHKHSLKLNANGGKLTGSDERTADYGTQIKLSDMAEASKTDDLRDYIFGGWKDEDGNIYGADDIITLTKDTTLTAVWKNGAYKEYTITFVLDSKTIKRVTYHYGDALPVFDAPKEADGYIFGGWSWYGAEGALSGQPDTMPASTLTAIGTTTKCYISYEFDGTVYGTKEVGKIGDTITLIAKPTKDYYDVTEWSADGITVTDGKFVMPAHDVTFKATSSPKFYNVNMTVDGSISSDSPMKAQYMSTVTLPEPPKKSGYTYYWQSDDVAIYEESGKYKFTMPHNDVSVECVYTTATYNVYYMIDGEATPYMTITDVPAGKEMFAYIDPPRKEGYLFNETWICTDASLVNKEGRYTMPDRDVYFCGRFAKNDDTMVMLGVEVYVDGNPETHYTLYTNKGETVTLPDIFMDGYTKSYESDKLTVTNGNVTIPTGDDVFEVSLRINFNKS